MAKDSDKFPIEIQDELSEILDLLVVLQNSVAFLALELPNNQIESYQTLFWVIESRLKAVMQKVENSE